jgi:hypothetical protein
MKKQRVMKNIVVRKLMRLIAAQVELRYILCIILPKIHFVLLVSRCI